MSIDDIVYWSKRIRPIVPFCPIVDLDFDDPSISLDFEDPANVDIQKRYLRELTRDELANAPFQLFSKPTDYAEFVNYDKLAKLSDRIMLLSLGTWELFLPKVCEVISQIPTELLEKTVAFEVSDSLTHLEQFFREELVPVHGGRVCFVRLYQAK
jgi:hypothetical protein